MKFSTSFDMQFFFGDPSVKISIKFMAITRAYAIICKMITFLLAKNPFFELTSLKSLLKPQIKMKQENIKLMLKI